MWTHSQSTGVTTNPDEGVTGHGYAGNGDGKNNPAMQNVEGIGPLPRGRYTIGPAYDHPHLGPVTMNLTPDPANEMYGRSEFRIHGDSKAAPGTASKGCIVQNHSVRDAINASDDKDLEVVE